MSRRRRSIFFLGIGCALAAVLAVVLFAGVGSGSGSPASPGQPAALTDTAPGIGPADAGLLELNVVPPQGALSAPDFALTDQHGRPVSLRQFRGKVVIWSLNDDRCTDMCALFAQSVNQAETDLGPAARNVVFLSVNANPYYTAPADLLAWSQTNDVEHLPNWFYATGTPAQLQSVWSAYKVTVITDPETRTVTHDTAVNFIDPQGKTRAYGYFGQGVLSTAYYAHAMAQMADDLLPAGEQVKVTGPTVGQPSTAAATVSSPAPAFDLKNLDGSGSETLTQARAKPLVLNFWSSTCAICTSEMPALQQVEHDYGKQVDVIGVDVADPRSTAVGFASALGVHYRLLADPEGTAAADYKVTELPVTFVISTSGSILARHEGALTAPELEAVLQTDFQQLGSP
jgi:cytochrome oxidase Cu insertion factor (SCO1/SenC/PrrC family)/thiol-disulfide isomerase/thioredoxin